MGVGAHVLSVALTLLVAQPVFPVPVQVEPPEALAVRAFIDDHLISFEGMGFGAKLRQGEHHFTLMDDQWLHAFELVPAANELAVKLRESYELGMTLFRVGMVVELGALVGVGTVAVLALAGATAVVSVPAIIAIAFVCAGVALIGAVISAISIPFLARAQGQMFELVSTYNHGLTRRPMTIVPTSPGTPSAPLLQFSI